MADELNIKRIIPLPLADSRGDGLSPRTARRNEDGSLTLYVKAGRSGSLPAPSAGARAQRDMARDLVGTAFGATGRTGAALTQSIRRASDPGTRTALRKAAHSQTAAAGQPVRSRERGPGLDECGGFGEQLPDYARQLQDNLGHQAQLDALAREMGDGIAQAYLAHHPGGGEPFALSTGAELKGELRAALSPHLDLSQLPEAFLDSLFNRAASQMLVNQAVPGSDHLLINGKTYRPDRLLGESAHSTVQLYTTAEGPPIALKLARTEAGRAPAEMDRANAALIDEIRSHRHVPGENVPGKGLSGKDLPGRVRMEGVIRTPGGGIGIAFEGMPKGTLHDAMTRLSTQVKAGHVSQTAARLIAMTLLKDTIDSLRQMPVLETPVDLTAQNVRMDADGRAKIVDFGVPSGLTRSDPRWQAPEVIIEASRARATGADVAVRTAQTIRAGQEVRARFHALDETSFIALVSNIRTGHSDQTPAGGGYTGGTPSQVWALGALGFALVFGRDLDGAGSVFAVEDNAIRFGRNPDNRAIDTSRLDTGADRVNSEGIAPGDVPEDAPMSYAGSSGSPEIDALLNQMLAPRPEQRPRPGDLGEHPAFALRGTGSAAVRDLIGDVLASEPDVARIRALSDRVDSLTN